MAVRHHLGAAATEQLGRLHRTRTRRRPNLIKRRLGYPHYKSNFDSTALKPAGESSGKTISAFGMTLNEKLLTRAEQEPVRHSWS